MEVDEDYIFDDQVSMEELGMDTLDDGTLIGSDDLVEYSDGGEEEEEEETIYIKSEPSLEDAIPHSVINSPNITVKRVINNKPIPTTLQRLTPKPTNLIRATNAAGQVVLLQKQTSTLAPVKLLNNAKANLASGTTTSYHLVKSESGSVSAQPKLAPTQTMIRRVVPATTAASSTGLAATNKAKTIAKGPTHVVVHTKVGSSGVTTTKTLTVAEAHQMGLLNNKSKQLVTVAKSKPAGISTTMKSPVKVIPSTSSTPTVVRLKQSPGAPGQVQRISTAVSASKTGGGFQSHKVVLPQSAIQAGQQSGQIQAINIPGKGIQYVRFLNQNNSGTTATTSSSTAGAQKIMQVQMNKTAAAAGAPPGSKIIVQNNKTYVVSNGNVTAVRAAPSTGQQANRVVTSSGQTIVRKVISASQAGIVRRDPEATTRYIAVVRKDDGKSSDSTPTTLKASQLSQMAGTTVMAGGTKTKIVMLPSSSSSTSSSSKIPASSSVTLSNPPSIISVKRESVSGSEDETRKGPAVGTIFPDEAYKKRPCNCTKSQCLKLYCDCFANGEFCYNCNCRDCYNNLDNEEERQKAIRATLERNPSAFKPKIGAVSAAEDALRQHTKGCNCKRSGCLKNYCECYEAKIPCSANCKCIGCRNTEQYAKEYEYATGVLGALGVGGPNTSGTGSVGLGMGGDMDTPSGDNSMAESVGGSNSSNADTSLGLPGTSTSGLGGGGGGSSTVAAAVATTSGVKRALPPATAAEPDLTQLPPSKQPYNFMTPDVIEATVQCMIAQADECQKRGCNIRTAERMILEEFGRCLVEIIEFSSKSDS